MRFSIFLYKSNLVYTLPFNLKYGLCSIAVIMLMAGCSHPDHKDKNRKEAVRIHPGQKLIPKSLVHIHEQIIIPQVYVNTSPEVQNIGEVIEASIETLYSQQSEITLTDPAVDFPVMNFTDEIRLHSYRWQLTVTLDNDIFSNTDYYYTNGFALELVVPWLNKSPVNKIFISTKKNDIELCGFSVQQNIYTPTNPDTRSILTGDRPFAGYLTIGQFREVYNLSETIYFKSELKLGVIGPLSLGQYVQSSLHEIEPVGWENQINNDFVIDYAVHFKKGLVNTPRFDFNLAAEGVTGTIRNNLGGGFDMRFGQFTPFYSEPLSVYGSAHPGRQWQCWIFFRTKTKFVIYDATLQGGMFNNRSPYTITADEMNRFVLEATAGLALYHKNIGIEYAHYYLSPEFKGARQFGWGGIKAILAF